MMKDEGRVKQRGTLNADFPAHKLVIKNTRADCSYHPNGRHWENKDKETSDGWRRITNGHRKSSLWWISSKSYRQFGSITATD